MGKGWLILFLGLLALPVLAGRDLDNRSGAYNGDYVADSIAVREPEQPEVIKKTVNIAIRERRLDIIWSDEKLDRCRIDSMFTTGYKTEIVCSHTTLETRYFITLAGTIGPSTSTRRTIATR